MINLDRFITAQENDYDRALSEIVNGKKVSHWMWYIFPQFHGLGLSSTSVFYAINSREEAIAYLNHDVLSARLIEISKALLLHKNKTATEFFGRPDDMKLKSCMTLFSLVTENDSVFHQVLQLYFDGKIDLRTKELICQ
jgi:uncharacterized protein (DUF1810 family)